RFRVRCPVNLALERITAADLLHLLAVLVAHPDLLVAGFVAHERNPLAVRRPHRLALANLRRRRQAANVAFFGGNAEQLAPDSDHRALARWRDVKAIRLAGEGER